MNIIKRFCNFFFKNRYRLDVVLDLVGQPKVMAIKEEGFNGRVYVLHFFFYKNKNNLTKPQIVSNMRWTYMKKEDLYRYKPLNHGECFPDVDSAKKYLNLVVWRDAHNLKKSITMKKQISKK